MCNWVRGIADVRVNVIDHEVGGNTGAAGPPRRQYWAPSFRARPRRTGRPGEFRQRRGRAAQASARRRRHGRHPRGGPAFQARQGSRPGHPLASPSGRFRPGPAGPGPAGSTTAAPTPGCATSGRAAAPGSTSGRAAPGWAAAPAARGSTGATQATPAAGPTARCSTSGCSTSDCSATAASRASAAGFPGCERASRPERCRRRRSRWFERTTPGLPGRDDGDPEVPRHTTAPPERAASRQEPGRAGPAGA